MVFVRRQIESLAHRGVSVDIFFLRSRKSPLSILSDALMFLRRVGEFRPEVVHAQYGTMTSFFGAVLSAAPLVITFRGSDLNPAPSMGVLHSAAGRLLSQLSVLRASRIICVSESLKNKLWWGRERCQVIPSGVDLSEFRPRPQNEARRLLGWPDSPPILLFNAGRSPAVKRLDLAQQAYECAQSFHPALELKILDGNIAPELMPLALNAADCLLFASDWEGSPNIVKEALACDLPIISVDVGDVASRLKGVKNSRIVARSAIALGEAVAEIIGLRERSDGHNKVRGLDINTIAGDVERLYMAAISASAERN